MNFSALIEEALEERGNAVMVVAQPPDGGDPVIRSANGVFARIVGGNPGELVGAKLSTLKNLIQEESDWSALDQAVRGLSPLKLDMQLVVGGRESWFGFALSAKSDPASGAGYGIVVGRDITEVKRRRARENGTQHLLASVFLRVAVPVMIVKSNGMIMMTNPAFQQLLGYEPEEIDGLTVDTIIPPETIPALAAARAKQLRDGERFEMRIDTVGKSGARCPVRVVSVLLRDAQDERFGW